MRKAILASIFLLSLISCNLPNPQHEITEYNNYLTIIPDQQSIVVSSDITYVNQLTETDSLPFLLHKNMNIESVECSDMKEFYFDTTSTPRLRYTPEAGNLVIKLNGKLRKGERARINIKYGGTIGITEPWRTNRVTKEWIELGLYSPWFPYMPELKSIRHETIIELPEEYKLVGNGAVSKSEQNKWKMKSLYDANDIVITASKDFEEKRIENTDYSTIVNTTIPLSVSTMETIGKRGNDILRQFNSWFGEGDKNASILFVPRKRGGGYARKGIIVLSNISDEDYRAYQSGYARYFAHELSHLWWMNAPTNTWEDWLNESFAECSAMMIVRNIYGEEEFEKRLSKKEKGVDKLPPVRGIDRNDPDAYSVLYNKGCALLLRLEKEIGKEQFLRLLKEVSMRKINKTSDLLTLLKESEGSSVTEKFEAWLDK